MRLSAIALVLIAAGSAHAAEKTLDRTFTVSPGGELVVDADGASVHVSAIDGNQVIVHMVFGGSERNLDDIKLDAIQKDNGVTVTARKPGRNWFSWGRWGKQEIEVKVPRRYGVNVRTGGGSISAKNVTGNVELRTSGGSIHVDTIRGDVDADTSGGSVQLLNIDGKIRGNTSGGSVRCSLVGANRGISVTTSGGSIELKLPRGTTANIEARTSGGQVSTEIPVTSTAREKSELVGTVNGGGERIYAHTSGGSIAVREAN